MLHPEARRPSPQDPVSLCGAFFSRLKQLDKHSQATAQQLVQLLHKQNQLLLERQSLSEEVGHLRAQVLCELVLECQGAGRAHGAARWDPRVADIPSDHRAPLLSQEGDPNHGGRSRGHRDVGAVGLSSLGSHTES